MGLWAIAFAFAMPLGVYSGWGAVLAINLQEFGISALAAGWLGCAMTLVGCFAGVIIGALTDRFRGNMKGAILACYGISTVAFLWFALTILGVVNGNRATLYVTGTVGGTFLNAPIPLFFELVRLPVESKSFHIRKLIWRLSALSTDYGNHLSNDCRGRRFCVAVTAYHDCPDRVLGRVVHSSTRKLDSVDELANGVRHAYMCDTVGSNAGSLQSACGRRSICLGKDRSTGLIWVLLSVRALMQWCYEKWLSALAAATNLDWRWCKLLIIFCVQVITLDQGVRQLWPIC